jgi:hypothetical protein
MYFFRLILTTFLSLLFAYYITVALQLFGVVTFTKKEISGKKLIIPFYYWFK